MLQESQSLNDKHRKRSQALQSSWLAPGCASPPLVVCLCGRDCLNVCYPANSSAGKNATCHRQLNSFFPLAHHYGLSGGMSYMLRPSQLIMYKDMWMQSLLSDGRSPPRPVLVLVVRLLRRSSRSSFSYCVLYTRDWCIKGRWEWTGCVHRHKRTGPRTSRLSSAS